MQPALPVVLPPPATASPVIAKVQLGPADFGGALAKLLAIVVPTAAAKAASVATPSTLLATPQVTTPTPTPTQTATATATVTLMPAPTSVPAQVPSPTAATAIPVAPAVTQLPSPLEGPPPATEPTITTPQTSTTVARKNSASTTRREPVGAATAAPAASAPVVTPDVPSPPPVIAAPAADVPAPTAQANTPSSHDTMQPQADAIAASPPPGVPAQPPTDPKPAADEVEPAAGHVPVALADVATQPSLPATAVITTPALATSVAPTTPAATPPAATPASPHATATPAEQIAPALVSLGHAPDGAQRLTMRLQPPELGQVQVRIDRPTLDAPARVAITVERPETLTLLLRDQPQLQRALDQAGVPAEGRSVTFHVATPEPSTRTDTATAAAPTGSTASMGGDFSHGTSRQSGKPTQGNSVATDDSEEIEALRSAPTNWLRARLDITA